MPDHDESPPQTRDPPEFRLDQPLPAHRPLDVTAFKSNRQLYFALRDLTGVAPRPVAMSLPGYFVLAHLDGGHDVAQIAAAFEREFGRGVAPDEILHVVHDLDQALLLQTERFEAAYAAQRDAYLRGDVRDNRARSPDAHALRSDILHRVLAQPPQPRDAPVRGIIAPHLDYTRGAPCYATAFSALLAATPPDRFVILGTNHFGRGFDRLVATTRDFLTPLGRVETDRAFLAAVERRFGASICEHEFDHLAEHSIELPVQILQVGLVHRAFSIVPVLCPDPAACACQPGASYLARFAAALRAELDADPRPTVVIASADLSHVGQKFGETTPTDEAFLRLIEDSDRRHLQRLSEQGSAEFVSAVNASGNQTRICSVGALATLRATLHDRPLRLLAYHQAADFANETHVTCAAAVVD